MGLVLLEAPAELPVSLADAHQQCHVDGTQDDALLGLLIGMATEQAEAHTGRALVTRRWRLTLDAFPCDGLELPRPPLVSVQSVSYLDGDGARVTLDPAAYQVVTDEIVGRLLPGYGLAWPACRRIPGSVCVDFTAGYGAAADVPQSIRQWILIAVATLYAQREAITAGQLGEIPRGFWDGLLDPYRIVRVA